MRLSLVIGGIVLGFLYISMCSGCSLKGELDIYLPKQVEPREIVVTHRGFTKLGGSSNDHDSK